MINSNDNRHVELAEALKLVGKTIENEKISQHSGHLYIQINPTNNEFIPLASPAKINLASFKLITQLVKEALDSKVMTLTQKKEMLEGYAQMISKYNEKKETLVEKIGNFFAKIIIYGWGQASEVDKADSMIKTYLPKYQTIIEKISPESEQEIKKQINEMAQKKQIEEKEVPKLLTDAKKMDSAAFTAKALAQEIEERLIMLLHKTGKISAETKENMITQRRGEPYSEGQFQAVFKYLNTLILADNDQNSELTEVFREYKMKVEIAEKYASSASKSHKDLNNKQNVINELENKIKTLENELDP